jgi:GT2 family glycosyltransferase
MGGASSWRGGEERMKVGAFVMTFNRPEGLEGSLAYLLGQSRRPDEIWVIDNGSGTAARTAVERYAGEGVMYHASGDNIGPAGALASGFRLLADAGCDWFLAVDDDNAPTEPGADRIVEELVDLAERCDDGRLGIVGISGSRFDWQVGEHVRVPDDELSGDLEVDVIGGGCGLMVSRTLVDDVGTPNPALFFGHEEVLFCLAARRNGYRIVVSGESMHRAREAHHRLGQEAVRRTVVATDPYHALWRRYYVTRNYIYPMRREFAEPRRARRMALKSAVQAVLAFGRGPSYGRRYSSMQLKGIIDGYRGRLGRTVPPVAKPEAR